MKRFLILMMCVPLFPYQICYANSEQHHKFEGFNLIKFMGPNVGYDYNDFKFNSTNGSNYKRYNGHTNSYRIGGSTIILGTKSAPSPAFGRIVISQRFTRISGDTLIAPAARLQNFNDIEYTNFDLGIKKPISKNVYFGVAGQYSYGRVRSDYTRGGSQTGIARSVVNNLSGSISLAGMKDVGYFKLVGDLTLAEVRTVTPSSTITWVNPAEIQTVNKVSRSSTWSKEMVRVSYHAKLNFTPYINAGLIQNLVAPNVTLTTITSNLPQLNVFKNGYNLGGGASIKLTKHIRMIASYNYLNLGSGLFKNNQANFSFAYGI